MKGNDVTWAVARVPAEASNTHNKNFLMRLLERNCKREMVFFPDPFSIYRMDHLCGHQKVYSFPRLPGGQGAANYIGFYARQCWMVCSRPAIGCLRRGEQPRITRCRAG